MTLAVEAIQGYDIWASSLAVNAVYDGWTNGASNVAAIGSAYSRFSGGQGISYSLASNGVTLYRQSTTTSASRGIRQAFYINNTTNPTALSSSSYNFLVASIAQGTASSVAINVYVLPTGAVGLYSSSPGVGIVSIATSATGLISAFAWYEVDLKVITSGSTSYTFANVYNSVGTLIATLSGTTTMPGSVTNWPYAGVIGGSLISSGWSIWFDDTTIYTASATTNADMLGAGPIYIATLHPSAAGSQTNWSNTGGSANWASVADATVSDSDTSYVSTSGTSTRDSYKTAGFATTPNSIIAVDDVMVARFDVSGTRVVATSQRIGTTNYDGAQQTLANTYGFFHNLQTTSPANTGNAYGVSEVANMELGILNVS